MSSSSKMCVIIGTTPWAPANLKVNAQGAYFPFLPLSIISRPLLARLHCGKPHRHRTPNCVTNLQIFRAERPLQLGFKQTLPIQEDTHKLLESPSGGLAFPQGLWASGEPLKLGSLHVHCLQMAPAPRTGSGRATFLLSNV